MIDQLIEWMVFAHFNDILFLTVFVYRGLFLRLIEISYISFMYLYEKIYLLGILSSLFLVQENPGTQPVSAHQEIQIFHILKKNSKTHFLIFFLFILGIGERIV